MIPESWERQALEKLLQQGIVEQRRARRWGIFFKLLFFAYLTLILMASLPPTAFSHDKEAHTAVIDINGMIAPESKNSAQNIVKGINRAFEDPSTKGVILRINSPGGTPVQADDIYQAILQQKKAHPTIKVYAVCSDICASGAYYVAASADTIYANPSSLVGSIGVLLDGFGFVGSMEKLGVERRLLTAGENKGFLDPFSPENSKQTDYAKNMLLEVQQQFIARVKVGRGARLKSDPDLFSGLVWTGTDAFKLGLIDGFANTEQVAENTIHVKRLKNYTEQSGLMDRLMGSMSSAFIGQLFERFFATRMQA